MGKPYRLDDKNRITLSQDILDSLGIKKGDYLTIKLNKTNKIELTRIDIPE